MRLLTTMILLMCLCKAKAQELYVFSEPASTRPAKSLAFGLSAMIPDSKSNTYFRNRYAPQITAGITKKVTVSVRAPFSNYYRLDKLQFDGVRLYTKYRFFSNDDVQKHFRLSAFVEGGLSTHDYVYDEMSLDGDNDGVQAGLIATQLVNKFAVSATASYMRVFVKNEAEHHSVLKHSSKMVSYSLSAGYLLLPREYVDYKQMNLNLYVELLGSKCVDNNLYLVDIAPALQFIFNSNTKISIGGRFQMQGNMLRPGERMLQLGIERTLLNVWK